jgi:catechol 2,3-dioxygenase-like lactoylglutathione lyase family enzyme
MAKVTGIGGVFFKSTDSGATRAWLRDNLGIPVEEHGWAWKWREREDAEATGYTILSVFKRESDYFDPSEQPFMVNLRVDDLDGMLAQLAERGITPLKIFPPEPNGRFAHVMGPDGIKLELWEPAKPDPYDSY